MSHPNAHTAHQLPSPAPSPYPTDGSDPDAVRVELEAQLLRLSQDLYEMEVCAGEVSPGMEDAVSNYLSKINTAFISLSNLAPHVTDSVPRNVVDLVDRYKNPHTYTKTTLSRATGENQYALGRVLGLESFRRQLHDAVAESFPTVPLPDRRHQPVGTEGNEVRSERGAEGESQSDQVASTLGTVDGAGSVEAAVAVTSNAPVASGPPAETGDGVGVRAEDSEITHTEGPAVGNGLVNGQVKAEP